MKAFKIQVVVTKTAIITEEEWREYSGLGSLSKFDAFLASQMVKGMLVEDLQNDPNRGYVKILAEVDY